MVLLEGNFVFCFELRMKASNKHKGTNYEETGLGRAYAILACFGDGNVM